MIPDERPNDESLDAELRNVPVPPGLLERLRAIGQAALTSQADSAATSTPALTDPQVDALLRDVPIPRRLVARIKKIARRPMPRGWLKRFALAAMVLVALWLGYAGAIVGSVGMFARGPELPPPPEDVQREARTARLLPALSPLERVEQSTAGGWIAPDDPAAFDPTQPALPPSPAEAPPAAAPLEATERWLAGEKPLDLLADTNLARWQNIATSHTLFEELPELSATVGLEHRGISPPRSPAFNIAVLSRWSVQPFILPGLDPALQSVEPPLMPSDASYRKFRRAASDGAALPAQDVRTEEFLAGLDFQYPRPTAAPLGLFLAGGPSPFRLDGRQMFQVGVQAWRAESAHPPTHLALVVDISASMDRAFQLDRAREAIVRLLDRLGPEDRLSLVVFSEDAYVLLEAAEPSARQRILAALDSLEPLGSTHYAAGLGAAYAFMQRCYSSPDRRIVLLTDGGSTLSEAAIPLMTERVVEGLQQGIHFDVVELCASNPDEVAWERIAAAGSGKVLYAEGRQQIEAALLEILTRQRPRDARDVRLRVSFNPKAVAAYRLVGHEAWELAGLRPAPLAVDFVPEQSATVLFEVILLPKGEAEVARVELLWKDFGGRGCNASASMRRDQFAPLWTKTAWQVQVATIAAEAAEALRGVPEVYAVPPFVRPRSRQAPLAQAFQVASEGDSSLLNRPAMAELLECLRQLKGTRPARGRSEGR